MGGAADDEPNAVHRRGTGAVSDSRGESGSESGTVRMNGREKRVERDGLA
jgi:hypothetical protein